MAACPGRGHGDVARDLAAARDWGAGSLLTLLEDAEFARLGVPGFAAAVAASGLRWRRCPIPDMQPPDAATLAAWRREGPALLAEWAAGGRVLVHCAAGLGRTGTIAARLLVGFGLAPEAAIARVRLARAGAIETPAQFDFIQHGPDLLELARRPG